MQHPWNTSFEWAASPGLGGALSASQIEQFDRDGCVVVRGAIDPSLVERLRVAGDELAEIEEQHLLAKPEGRDFIGEAGAISFTVHVAAKSDELRAFTVHPTMLAVTRDLIGDNVRLYWDQLVYKRPEKSRRFPWHQDNGYAFVDCQKYVTIWTPLTVATVDNGCPWIVPGRHMQGTLQHTFVDPLGWECLPNDDDHGAVSAEVEPGDLVIFSSLTPHLTGPNVTDAVRKAYIVQYVQDGAAVWLGDAQAGPPTQILPCDAPDRQYVVVRDGAPVAA